MKTDLERTFDTQSKSITLPVQKLLTDKKLHWYNFFLSHVNSLVAKYQTKQSFSASTYFFLPSYSCTLYIGPLDEVQCACNKSTAYVSNITSLFSSSLVPNTCTYNRDGLLQIICYSLF